MAKKLKVEDIPEGFNYAAVDSDGWAYAYVEKPELLEDSFHGDYDPLKKSYYIGMGYDTTDWKNSLVSRETSEQTQFKTELNWAHIPQVFNYAAVHKDGSAWAFQQKPVVNEQYENWVTNIPEYFFQIGQGFDSTDWQNSLVAREPAERPQRKKLTAADIPEGYNYAAVDKNGSGYAFAHKPDLFDRVWGSATRNTFLGSFDNSDWQDSLVSRRIGELPELKKLTAADIPEGYNFAAIDSDGQTYVYTQKPTLGKATWHSLGGNFKFFSLQFDPSDWQDSLVSLENQETFKFRLLSVEELMKVVQEFQEHKSLSIEYMKSEPETAYKETANKLSYSEIDPYFLEQMARRMQKGKEKYGRKNWKKLSDINELLDAAQRHLIELRKMVQEDFEPLPGQESEAQHCAALACNAMFIHYHLNPNA